MTYSLTIEWAHGEKYDHLYEMEPATILLYAQSIISEKAKTMREDWFKDKSKPLACVTRLEIRIIQ